MLTKSNGQATQKQGGGLAPTVERFLDVKKRQKAAEASGRKLKKEADTLETALSDAVETSEGMTEAGPYVLGFEFEPGDRFPPWKGICEQIVQEHGLSPSVIADKLAALPQRRKLVIA